MKRIRNTWLEVISNTDGTILTLETWHKINGQWVHIYADYKNNKFYTNGKLEE